MLTSKYISQSTMNKLMDGRLAEIRINGKQGDSFALYSDDPSAYICCTLVEQTEDGKWLIERW